MEHRQSPLDNNEDKRRQNSAKKPSDASPSERLQKSRNSHLIGRGINPRDGLSQQVGTDEAASSRVDKQNTTHHDTQNSLEHDTDRDPSQNAKELAKRETREKQAITTPSDRTSDLSSTQDRNEKRQFSALEEEQFRQWSKSIPLDEYGHRAPKTIELADFATRDKPIGVGGMLGSRFREKGESSNGGQITDTKGWIGKKLGNYELVKFLREERDDEQYLRWVYSGKGELVEVNVPKEAGKWIGKKLGGYDLVEYLREDRVSLIYLGKHVHSGKLVEEEVEVEVKVLKERYKKDKGIVAQFHKEADILHKLGQMKEQRFSTILPQNVENMCNPHIVRVLECYKAKTWIYDDDVNYLVMEHASRGTLQDVYPRLDESDSHWTLEKVVAVMRGLADALDCLHNYKDKRNRSQPHLHGNIRPETVLLDEHGRTILSGCKHVREESDLSIRDFSRGYDSPEKQKSVKSDQYSIAVVAYELLTGGQYPFPDGHTPNMEPEPLVVKIKGGAVPTEVQENIRKVLSRAMAYNPGARYESVKIFAEELEKACFGRMHRQRPSCDEQRNLYIKIAQHDVAIRSNEYDINAYIGKGQAFSELGHDEEAVEVYREAKKHYSNTTTTATVAHFDYLLGVAYSNLGRYPEAVTAFDNTIRTNEKIAKTRSPFSVPRESDESTQNDIVEAYYYKGNAYSKMRNYPEAVKSFNKVIRLGEEKVGIRLYIEAHLHKGKALAEYNDHQEALKAFSQVTDRNRSLHIPSHLPVPNAEANEEVIMINREYSVEAYCYMGRSLDKLGRSQEAKAVYEKAKRLDQEYAKAIVALIEREDLNRNAEPVVPEAPSNAPVDRNHNGVRVAPSMYPIIEGSPEYQLPPEIPGPSNIDVTNGTNDRKRAMDHYQRGLKLAEQRDHQGAVEAFSEAINLNSNHADTYYERGNAYSKLGGLGNYEKAVEDYKEATHLNSNHTEAYCQLGEALSELGNCKVGEDERGAKAFFEEAVEAFRGATRCNHFHEDAHSKMAMMFYRLRRMNEGDDAMDRAKYIRILQQQH